MFKKLKTVMSLALIAGLGLSLTTNTVSASSEDVNTISTKEWEDAVVVYGAYLEQDADNKAYTDKLLGTLPSDVEGYVYSDDAKRFTNADFGDMYLKSSIRIQKTKEGSGLDVEINQDGGKITKITEDMYINALLTSGIYDAKVEVASFEDVTGESALSGVFKAQEIMGEKVDEGVTQVAQEELSTVADINEQNKDQEGFSEEQLNKAISEIKTEVSKKDGKLTEDEVRKIVDEKLAENGLTDFVSNEQKERIIIIIIKGQEVGVFSGENAEKIIESGKEFVGKIMESEGYENAKEKAKDLGTNLKDTVQSEGFWDNVQNFLDKVVGFFKGIFTSK